MAKKEEKPVEVDLMDVFTQGEDGRLFCAICAYDTQLPGAARRHTLAVHQTALKPLPIFMKTRGVVPEEMPTEFVPVSVPAIPDTGKGA